MTNRISCSPLTGRIHQGRVNKAGDCFVGEKKDVTSEVLRALIEKAEYHGGNFVVEAAGMKWSVLVNEVVPPSGGCVERREFRDPAADARDAARYRCLRAMSWDASQFAVVRDPKNAVKLGHYCPSRDQLDEAIDAALALEAGAP